MFDKPFVQHFRRSYRGALEKIVEDPVVGAPAIFREAINQDWIVSLTKDAAGDWKLSVELPGMMEFLQSIGGSIEKTAKKIFGEKMKFGIAIAGKGKSEIMGIPLYKVRWRL